MVLTAVHGGPFAHSVCSYTWGWGSLYMSRGGIGLKREPGRGRGLGA